MTFGHGGNIYEVARQHGCRPSDIVDMSSNINPLGPPPGLLEFLKDKIGKITRLPEIDNQETIQCFADYLGIEPDRLLVGNGTTQFIYSIPQALKISNSIVIGPTYSDYQDSLRREHIPAQILLSSERDNFRPDFDRIAKCLSKVDTVFLCNPNNPTGVLIPSDELYQLCRSHPRVNFIIDESYLPFVLNADKESLIDSGLGNVIVLLSISKIFGIPGLRIGFVIASREKLNMLGKYFLPWSVNSLAQEAVRYLAGHKTLTDTFIRQTRMYCEKQRQQFHDMLDDATAIKLYPGKTPFILAGLPEDLPSQKVQEQLARDLIVIRNCENFQGLSDQFIRISLKSSETNQLIAANLKALVKGAIVDSAARRVAC